jgi:hypothetical protein
VKPDADAKHERNFSTDCVLNPIDSNLGFKPNLLPMKAVLFEVIFSLGARKNNGAILLNIAPLFSEPRVRTLRGKEFE